MKKIKFFVTVFSLVLGLAGTYAFAPYFSNSQPVKTSYTAWWGGIYPEYCLPDAVEQVEGETQDGKVHVMIRFQYLTFLNGDGA